MDGRYTLTVVIAIAIKHVGAPYGTLPVSCTNYYAKENARACRQRLDGEGDDGGCCHEEKSEEYVRQRTSQLHH